MPTHRKTCMNYSSLKVKQLRPNAMVARKTSQIEKETLEQCGSTVAQNEFMDACVG